MRLQKIKEQLFAMKAEAGFIAKQRESTIKDLEKENDNFKDADDARTLIQVVAQLTQKELEYHVSELTTLALSSIFPEPYSLNLEFDIKRGKTEAVISFVRENGLKIDPMLGSGGGPIDVASFALRVTMWSLSKKTVPVIVLDEPFRFVSNDLQNKLPVLLKQISEKLGIQFIMITHKVELMDDVDKMIPIVIKKGVSRIAKEK